MFSEMEKYFDRMVFILDPCSDVDMLQVYGVLFGGTLCTVKLVFNGN